MATGMDHIVSRCASAKTVIGCCDAATKMQGSTKTIWRDEIEYPPVSPCKKQCRRLVHGMNLRSKHVLWASSQRRRQCKFYGRIPYGCECVCQGGMGFWTLPSLGVSAAAVAR
ncbi:unnamed protein product [Durusdinium trenchii]|uniref:Uncharacterized protein n=1 Tax=Durusdinium trenchii TaxID=1381693 RepID=A0ABP0JQ68_9DINO